MIARFVRPLARKASERLTRFPRLHQRLKRLFLALPPAVRGRQLIHDHLRRLATSGPPPFFVQVGANDGLTNDHLYPFVVRHNWRGLAIEPVPAFFATLQRTQRLRSRRWA